MRPFLLLFLFLGALFLVDCQSRVQDTATTEQTQQHRKKHHQRHRNQDFRQRDTTSSGTGYQQDISQKKNSVARTGRSQVPQKALNVLAYVRANGRAIDGYVGGRRFGNFENHLPRSSTDGKPINYREWDVNPKISGKNRGIERLITGSDNRAWYTNDHYNTFTEIAP